MKSLLGTMSLIGLFCLLSIVAFAQVAAPIDANSAVGLLPTVMNFAKNGQFLLAGAVITLILCFVVNQYVLPKLGLGSAVIPLFAGVVGVLSGVSLAVANGAAPLAAALAVMSGPAAIHLWEMVAKYFFNKSDDAAPAAPAAPAASDSSKAA